MRATKSWILAIVITVSPAVASAQTETESESSIFWDVTKSVVFDPTTYIPAAASYTSMKLDWDTSQPLFRNGWAEQNHRFTISGRANDVPVDYREGNRRIRRMALLHLQESVVNNLTANLLERVLAERYPQHRKLFKVLSWVERIAFASYVTYFSSANHLRQAERNRELARQYGYR